jgi:AraC-like DNA-binding protein
MVGDLDVQSVAAAQRALLWKRSAGRFFPGLSVRLTDESLAVGSIRGLAFGAGRLWSVLSPPLLLDYTPSGNALDAHFSVMLQLEGSTLACQRQHQCRLERGDFCLIDSNAAFRMEVTAPSSHIMFIQMPRAAVLGRHPSLERYTACTFNPHETGSALLRSLLFNVVDCAHRLTDPQRAAVLGAVIQLLGAPSRAQHGSAHLEKLPWRVRAALSCIEDHVADRNLNATRVAQAQGISRRRLDELMQQGLGRSLSTQIAEQRLQLAAAALADPQRARLSVLQIAFAAGFEDPAHFSRAFKRRFGYTPRQWRAGHL